MSFAEECYKILEQKKQEQKEKKIQDLIKLTKDIKNIMNDFYSDNLRIKIYQKKLNVCLPVEEIVEYLDSFGFKDIKFFEDTEIKREDYYTYDMHIIEFTIPEPKQIPEKV